MSALEAGADRRDLVDAAGDGDANLDARDFFQRQADHAIVQRTVQRRTVFIHEAPGDDGGAAKAEIVCGIGLIKKTAGIDETASPRGANTEDQLVGAPRDFELLVHDRFVHQNVANDHVRHHRGREQVDAARADPRSDPRCAKLGGKVESCGRSAGGLDHRNVLNAHRPDIGAHGHDRSTPRDGERVARP